MHNSEPVRWHKAPDAQISNRLHQSLSTLIPRDNIVCAELSDRGKVALRKSLIYLAIVHGLRL